MIYELEKPKPSRADHQPRADGAPAPAPVVAGLSPSFAFTERAAGLLRAYLDANQLHDYRIFRSDDGDLVYAEQHLGALGEAGAAWEPLPPLVAGGRDIVCLTHHGDNAAYPWETGVLRLRRHGIVLARWYWITVDGHGSVASLQLVAARAPADVTRLRDAVRLLRRDVGAAVWQIVRGEQYKDLPRTPRPKMDDIDLLLGEELRQRVEADIVRFFLPEVAALYRGLRVPYRRGVLLHGPPGNGKTSLIRLVGARLPDVPVLILRPDAEFDTDDLEEVIRRWTQQAPAILVIEDLNWLLDRVNVSTFLNLLDGIESPAAGDRGGLLLVATTNYPEKLDPAVNNRPGRFDVVIEVRPPGGALRLEFLRRQLPDLPAAALESAAQRTRGLSFAHLNEVLRLSGLNALQAGRSSRAEEDVARAVEAVVRMNREATDGFAGNKPEMPFGLLPLRDRRAAD